MPLPVDVARSIEDMLRVAAQDFALMRDSLIRAVESERSPPHPMLCYAMLSTVLIVLAAGLLSSSHAAEEKEETLIGWQGETYHNNQQQGSTAAAAVSCACVCCRTHEHVDTTKHERSYVWAHRV